jgi:hypothetical protein
MLFLLGAVYFVLLVTLGTLTFRKRHFVLFWVGIIFPVLWVIGAVMAPKEAPASETAPV